MSKETILSHLIFDGYAVYRGLDDKARSRTSPENVSDVLDTLNRLSKQRDACGWPTCECALTPSQCKAPTENAAEPAGEVVAFGEHLHEVAWKQGKLPALGTKLYAAPVDLGVRIDEIEELLRDILTCERDELTGLLLVNECDEKDIRSALAKHGEAGK